MLASLPDTRTVVFRKVEVPEGVQKEEAAKVVPALITIRPGEENRVSSQLKSFFPKLKHAISKERNKEIKEALKKETISSDVRKALELNAFSENIV